jgi:hypothetical protein
MIGRVPGCAAWKAAGLLANPAPRMTRPNAGAEIAEDVLRW